VDDRHAGDAMTRLWEVDHPYYCSESNYYVGGLADPPHDHYEFTSWAEFGWKDSDPDLNLVFRWDWYVPDPADYEGSDVEMPPETLTLFVMMQRKGRFVVCSMPVDRSDELAIRAWLAERAKTIAAIWAPIELDHTRATR
jgi:hypothetical protein